jgi:hypothetical protein
MCLLPECVLEITSGRLLLAALVSLEWDKTEARCSRFLPMRA